MITTLAIAAACAWTDPGRDPYRGTVDAALARYSIPADVRSELSALISAGTHTDIATLTRDSMTGQRGSYVLTDMHFGAGRVCGTMDRSAWSATYSIDRVPVYCVGSECVAIPSICGNVSRVTLLAPPLIRRLPPATTIDEIPGGTGLAEQTLPDTLPGEAFATRSMPLEMPSASATAAPGATIGSDTTTTHGAPAPTLAGPAWTHPSALLRTSTPLPSGPTPYTPAQESAVVPIPEPAIWSMILAGLGIVGFKTWRARKT